MKHFIILAITFTNVLSCCNPILFEDESTFEKVHQKVYQDDVELIFRVFLFKYGRFPINITEIADSVQNDSSMIDWFSLKMTDPFSENNEPFQYLSFNDGRDFLLISRGPDHKLNQYDCNSSLTSILNSPLLLTDSECSDTTNYQEKDIIVLCSEAKSMLISNSKIMDSSTEYFDEMIAQNKRYTYSIKQVLLYMEPERHFKLSFNTDSTNLYIDIVHKGWTFRFFMSDYMNNTATNVGKMEQSFTVSGVYSGYDEYQKIFTYQHGFYELMKPIKLKNDYIEHREGSAFNINRCNFSRDSSIKQ